MYRKTGFLEFSLVITYKRLKKNCFAREYLLTLKVKQKKNLKKKSISLVTRETADISLAPDVSGMIHFLYQDLEKYHGEKSVERVLGLLAAGTDGMNTDDILNILSCDEELLQDVLVWHQPPKRRLPPLLLARLKHDLGPFLVERGAYGVSLLALYHR